MTADPIDSITRCIHLMSCYTQIQFELVLTGYLTSPLTRATSPHHSHGVPHLTLPHLSTQIKAFLTFLKIRRKKSNCKLDRKHYFKKKNSHFLQLKKHWKRNEQRKSHNDSNIHQLCRITHAVCTYQIKDRYYFSNLLSCLSTHTFLVSS